MDENERKVYFEIETATSRRLGVIADEQHGLFRVTFVDGRGGSIPESLKGRFTGVRFAREALQDFVDRTFEEVEKHTRRVRKPEATVAA